MWLSGLGASSPPLLTCPVLPVTFASRARVLLLLTGLFCPCPGVRAVWGSLGQVGLGCLSPFSG